MTRSVEIPEAAVEAAALAMFADEHCDKRQMLDVRGNWDARLNDEDQALYRSMARAALAAALPHLAPAEDTPCNCGFGGFHDDANPRCDRNQAAAPAEPCPTCNGGEWVNGHWVARRETVGMVCQTCGHDYAPAGDGGLREALEKLAAKYDSELGTVSYQWLSEKILKPLLAAHPAAPAVPQPVDRGALEQLFETNGVFETTFISTERMESSRRILADSVLALLAGEQEQVER